VRAHAVALRDEILKGAKFEDLAKRESADTVSGANGGFLGRTAKGAYVPAFEKAAYALTPGQISEPVETQFGVHLIKVDEKKGDTIAVRHILLRYQQSDSSASRTDKRADSLAKMAAAQTTPQPFDGAAKALKLTPAQGIAMEGEPLTVAGQYVPSVSAWAFSGVKVGETSDLFDSDNGYVLARLDSLHAGGLPPLPQARDEIKRTLVAEKKLDKLMTKAKEFATAAATSTLESAASSHGLTVTTSEAFTRGGFVAGLGRLNEAIGAAFSLPVGTVSSPVKTSDAVAVIRVDRRVDADHAAWEAQKATQRQQVTQGLRQQRIQAFLQQLRTDAKIDDRRKTLAEAAKQTTS
jgi:parvulin-like peptidyl-prolyl isomerase